MTIKYLPVFASHASNQIVSFLEVDDSTFPANIVIEDGLQKIQVVLKNGSQVLIGEVAIEVEPQTRREYYAIRATTEDDQSIAVGAVGSNVPNLNIHSSQEWIETGFAGQRKEETWFEDDFQKMYYFV